MEDSSNKKVQLPDDVIRYIFSYLSEDVLIKLIMAFGMEKYFKNILLSNRLRKKLCYEACKEGYLNTLIWAREHGCPWTSFICAVAAQGGHLDCLIWAREHGCDWNSGTCFNAARGGHLACLIWAREHGCPWNSGTCSTAADGGHLECLIWAREHGCDWDECTCLLAASGGHFDCLIWAIEHGCRWYKQLCLNYIKDDNMKEWINKHNNENIEQTQKGQDDDAEVIEWPEEYTELLKILESI